MLGERAMWIDFRKFPISYRRSIFLEGVDVHKNMFFGEISHSRCGLKKDSSKNIAWDRRYPCSELAKIRKNQEIPEDVKAYFIEISWFLFIQYYFRNIAKNKWNFFQNMTRRGRKNHFHEKTMIFGHLNYNQVSWV